MCCPVACPALPQYRTLHPFRSSGPHPQPWGSLGMGRRGDLQGFRFLKASVSVLAAFPILSLAAVGLSPPSICPALQHPCPLAARQSRQQVVWNQAPPPPHCCQPGFPKSGSTAGDGLCCSRNQQQGRPGLLGRTRPHAGEGGGAGALPAAGGTPWIPVPHSGVSRAVSGHSCSRNSSVCIPLCLPAMGSSSELALPKARHTVSADPCSGQGGLSCRAGRGAGGGHPSTVCPSSAVGAPLGRAAWGPGLWLAVLLWFSLAAAGLRAHKWKSGIWPGSPACWLPGGTQPLLVRPLAAPPLAS